MGYFVKIKENVKIYVEDLNPMGKEIILFLHGWPGSHKLFEYQMDVLPKFGFRCIGIDTRGFGESDKPYEGYDYDTLADDVYCVIKTLQLQNITLVGHSTGGAIAVRYMRRHNAYQIRRLVLMAAAAPSLVMRPDFPYGLPQDTVTQIIQDTNTDRPHMLRNFGELFFYQHTSEAFMDWFFQLGLQAAGWATAAIANTWLNEVLFDDLQSIHVPTLIIHGIHDKVVPFPLGEIQHNMISDSKLISLEFSGHGSFYDQKDEVNEQLIDFMET